jgi:hypothetical protein
MIISSFSLYAGEKTQINVKVTDSNQKPVSGVIASIRKLNSIDVLKTVSNEDGGQLILDRIKKGKYIILISKNDFTNAVVASFEITEIDKQPVEISVVFGAKESFDPNLSFTGATQIEVSSLANL